MTFFNGKKHTYGLVDNIHDKNVKYASFDFTPGEYLINDLILTGNGSGTRLGYIEFQTNLGKTFKAGQANNK